MFTLQRTLHTPAPISHLSFNPSGRLFAGSDDGSLRVYHPSSSKVLKAIRGLGSEIFSVTACKGLGSVDELGKIWLACGRMVFAFDINSTKMILVESDATVSLTLGEDDGDTVNELSLSSNEKTLAFCLDSGVVGTVDLSSNNVTTMKTIHGAICGMVRFIPDRPSELVSGGYDSALLHFNFTQGALLSRYDIAALPPSAAAVSLSPPFILCMSLSPTGLLAAATADGHLWIGAGGEKRPGKKKRSSKWEGLRKDESIQVKVAEGPIVGVAFSDPTTIICCTLLGIISLYQLSRDPLDLKLTSTLHTENMEKVNTLAIGVGWLAVGGFGKDKKGVVELWNTDLNVDINAAQIGAN